MPACLRFEGSSSPRRQYRSAPVSISGPAMAEPLKLSALLPDNLNSLADRARERLCENEQVGGMKLAWGYVGGQLTSALTAALDCDLMEVLAKSWATARLLA